MPDEVPLTGRREAPTIPRQLRAGPLTCVLDGIELRDLRWGEVEVANLIYVAVRDEHWNTVPATVSGLEVTSGQDRFWVGFSARHVAGELDLSWDGQIVGDRDGTVRYTMDATAQRSFQYNRIGCNVLHSATAVAGRSYRTSGGDDGGVHAGVFPFAIAPQVAVAGRLTGMLAPFRRMTMDVGGGLEVVVEVTGDEFETEDQRNFGDATFKTYSTPLQRPAPFRATAGTRLIQSVVLSVGGDATAALAVTSVDPVVRIAIGAEAHGPLPRIGLGAASDGVPMDGSEVSRIAALRPAHLRVVLEPLEDLSGSSRRLTAAGADAHALGTALEVELRLGANATGLEAAIELLSRPGVPVARFLVQAPGDGPIDSGTPAQVVMTARRRLDATFPDIPVGAQVSNLSALLREPVDAEALGSVGLPLCPSIHRDDDQTVMENTIGLDEQVARAGEAIGGRPVHVGPVTLSSVAGPWPRGTAGASGLPPQVDVRQPSLFAAAWTVGSMAALLRSGAASLTLYETCGWRGVTERTGGGSASPAFLSRPGATFPVWHVLADLAVHAGGVARRVDVSDPVRVAALAVSSSAGSLMLVANRTRQTVDVALSLGDLAGQRYRLGMLDETTAPDARDDPAAFRRRGATVPADATIQLTLTAYAVATLELSG